MTENQKKIKEQEEKLEKLQKTIDSLKEENTHLNSLLHQSKTENSQLNSVISDYEKYFEDLEDQERMTIRKGKDLLISVFEKISCPITRRESAKQFIAYVLKHKENELESSERMIEKLNNDISFKRNNINDLKEFTDRILNDEVKYGN